MNELFEAERIARTTNNLDELQAVQFAIINASKDTNEILQNLKLLQNKRKQSHKCIKNLIKYLVETKPEVELLYRLLNEVVAGKMYLEFERIQIAELLTAKDPKNTEKCYEIYAGIPVETFTSIDEPTKNDFLFETFRLGFLMKKHVECELTLRKIRQTDLNDPQRLIFLNYKILLKRTKNSYLEASALYQELIKLDPTKKNVTHGALFSLCITSSLEKTEITDQKMNQLKFYATHKQTDENMRNVVLAFMSNCVLEFSIIEKIVTIVREYESGFLVDSDALKLAIMEHNFRIIVKFFSKATVGQISKIMQISPEETIDFISRMVNEKLIIRKDEKKPVKVKINQQNEIVDLGRKKWNDCIETVLDKIILVNHLIDMEELNKNTKS